jgi:hypothetical protein
MRVEVNSAAECEFAAKAFDCNSLGLFTWRVHHEDIVLGGRLHINVINASSSTTNQLQVPGCAFNDLASDLNRQ